jgi:DNA-binding phage protein
MGKPRARGNGVTPPEIVEVLKKVKEDHGLIGGSAAIGISLSQLHRYLRGIGCPTLETIQKIADFTETDFEIKVTHRPKSASL